MTVQTENQSIEVLKVWLLTYCEDKTHGKLSLNSLSSLSLGVGKLTVFPDNEIILKSMEIFFFLQCTNFSAVAIHQHQFSVLVRHAFDVSN